MKKSRLKSVKIISILFLIFLTCSKIPATTNYVSKTGNHVSPFTSWANAATNIQSAVDVASSDNTVLVTNGTYNTGGAVTPGYSCLNRVVITNNITVKSLNGPENTVIFGKGPRGSNAVRGVYMSAGILDGFFLSNGHTRTIGHQSYDRGGGGVNLCVGKGVVTNCTINGNMAHFGGGVFCRTESIIKNCNIYGNFANWGGGVVNWLDGTIQNCIINRNTASGFGGGYCGNGIVLNCIISSNSASNGGGIFIELDGIIRNCIINDNSANSGGGVFFNITGTVQNCTISRNTATGNGGGTYYGAVNNCIIWDNSASSGSNFYGSTINYSCSYPLPSGEGNIFDNPQFVSVSNFHLQATSPCRNAGTNLPYVYNTTDLDGNPRLVGDRVDMGAYEFVPEPCLFIIYNLLFMIYYLRRKFKD